MRLKAFVCVAVFLVAQTVLAPNATFKPVEGNAPPFEVQFNPKEITIDKPVPWEKGKKSTDDSPALEFTAAEPKTLACELMFDTFEQRGDVYKTYISRLEQLVSLDSNTKRPPMVTFVWGSKFPTFKGVIENMNVKYTMFLEDGTPCRATVTVKMKQADSTTTKKSSEEPNK